MAGPFGETRFGESQTFRLTPASRVEQAFCVYFGLTLTTQLLSHDEPPRLFPSARLDFGFRAL